MKDNTFKILIVDDEIIIAQVMLKYVQTCGYSAVAAYSCEEAIQRLLHDHFDLIFLDIDLPDGDGIELMSRSKEILPEINIVTMTGKTSREIEVRARERRIVFFLIKPFSMQEVQSIVNHLASRKAQQKQQRLEVQ